MKLKKILKNIDYETISDIDNIEIEDIAYNSRNVKENYIFVCISGETLDGHEYIMEAYNQGCRVFVVEKDIVTPKDTITLKVKNSRIALSKISANFFGNPSDKLKVIGITGTKGKTTVTNYISSVLNKAKINTGTIGTNGVFYNDIKEKTYNTTPESYEVQKTLDNMVNSGVEVVIMEISSAGIMMNRVDDINFDVAVYLNIATDHIGPKEHPTFEHYLDCKAKLFTLAKHGIVNIDDAYSDYVIKKATCSIETFSIIKNADSLAKDIEYTESINELGIKYSYEALEEKFKVYVPSPGMFSIYNSLAVISVCKYLGIENNIIVDALQSTGVKGRVEILPILPYAKVIIDYAHNGVSLENILQTLKMYKHNRLICLFGSVGGRTELRRKELGDVAARECDLCILTSDNPNFENPMNIIRDIARSFEDYPCEYIVEADRKKAIEFAIKILKQGDILVLAGKGHEEYQLINGEQIYFNEKEIATSVADNILKNKDLLA